MTDLALAWDSDRGGADLALVDGRLETDNGLRTAVLISLFADAQAELGEALPGGARDRRGWWGDEIARGPGGEAAPAQARDRTGSLLWLLSRSVVSADALRRARDACEDALDWLVRDGIARAVRVVTETQGTRLAIAVAIERANNGAGSRFDFVWDAEAERLTAMEAQ
ncbi:MAG: hypothetical protein COW16_10355 [Sphingomonadales bacterium CG12_big_fil_rev_8_21_14_0_65_65_10]|nr:MAG: hypothetical protein COW16_10355 [Sphingomonadales bacterium CG12_big_fil_rev_8_21_14_0_65_65_10]